MISVSQCFESLQSGSPSRSNPPVLKPQCALIPFITAGDPDLTTTAKALELLDRSGADLIELGIPYSDPLADGPVIQAAATRALQRGTTLNGVLEMLTTVSPTLKAPVILFTYYNPILTLGIRPFLEKIYQAGARGLVIPDLPLEEAEPVLHVSREVGIDLTLLIAPTSPHERILEITRQSQGFIYLVSVTGVTGMRTQLQDRVQTLLQQIQTLTDKPVGVGFGISQPEQAQQVRDWGAHAVIVGSAFVKRLAEGSPEQGLESLAQFCRELKTAIATDSQG
ncbi:MAG: tryptophan synthase subunit alpha [Oscillatoriales cyanobacterium RM2_1_1]|nr:tryptophan synthase subunit alpha [Oscillatoriales cyanobacterium SM2_3_0]NJO46115.1 tryptophan synthase subunit alpha [Oscillatoriales cyanobacterium RM2_1_1]